MRPVPVVALRTPVYLAGFVDKIISVYVIYIAVAIIIHPGSAVKLVLIDPHVLRKVRMVVLHAEVEHRYYHFRTAGLEPPRIGDIDVGSTDSRRGNLLAPVIVIVPLGTQLRVIERAEIRRSGHSPCHWIGPSVGRQLQPVVELHPADFLISGHHVCKAVEVGGLAETQLIPAGKIRFRSTCLGHCGSQACKDRLYPDSGLLEPLLKAVILRQVAQAHYERPFHRVGLPVYNLCRRACGFHACRLTERLHAARHRQDTQPGCGS